MNQDQRGDGCWDCARACSTCGWRGALQDYAARRTFFFPCRAPCMHRIERLCERVGMNGDGADVQVVDRPPLRVHGDLRNVIAACLNIHVPSPGSRASRSRQ